MTDHQFSAPGLRDPDPDGNNAPEHAGDPEKLATPLDDLRAELTAELARYETFDVDGRPGYAVRYDVDIEHPKLGLWRKRAKDTTQPDGLDELKWAATILAAQAVAVVRHGVDVFVAGDHGVAFNDPELRSILDVGRAIDAVRKFYGRDAAVVTTAYAVLNAAGYGKEAIRSEDDGEDPTRSSSTSS